MFSAYAESNCVALTRTAAFKTIVVEIAVLAKAAQHNSALPNQPFNLSAEG
jgi:hypothetical protein